MSLLKYPFRPTIENPILLNELNVRNRRGFSLLELMIVVVLIAGILAIAWPSIARPMRKAELGEATQKLREAIEDGRYQAMISGEPVFLQITQGDSQMRSGGIDALIRGKLDEKSDLQESASGSANAKLEQALSNDSDSALSAHPVTSRVWTLPENIVVSSVHWMDDASASAAMDSSEAGFGASAGDSGIYSSGNASIQELSDESLGSSEKWCLPTSAQGLGRDAEITLLDKRARKTLTVSFTAATGELEIVR